MKSLECACYIDAAGFGLRLAECAETRNARRVVSVTVVHGLYDISEGAVSLRAPHDPVKVVRFDEVFLQGQPELVGGWIVEANRVSISAIQVSLLHLLDVRDVLPEHIFAPGEDLHAPLLRCRNH